MSQTVAVGIDLGTTFSSLAYVDDRSAVQTLRLADGGFTVASAICFRGPGEILVGTEALNYSVVEPGRVARAFKRRMGDSSYRFECDGTAYRPEELSAMILKKLLMEAELLLGPIEEAVIAVPFAFGEVHRRATIDAGRIAGLQKVDLIEEPVAASLAYSHTLLQGGLFGDAELNELFGGEATVLVYDLGGGTFDVTVTQLNRDGKFEALATGGDTRLGGEDWDEVLFKQVMDEYIAVTKDDLEGDRGLKQELLLKTVEAKKTLSERPRAEVTYDWGGKRQAIVLKLGDFEAASAPLLARTRLTMEQVLADKGVTWGHIERILLVGGSSRMPMVRKMIEMASKRQIDMSLPPDVAIAQGAALYAALKAGRHAMRLKEVRTVNSHPLGVRAVDTKTAQARNDVLLPANEPTGKLVTRRYGVTPGKRWGKLSILSGADADPDACLLLGQGWIRGLPEDSAEGDTVDVTFSFQENGLLYVSAIYRRRAGGEVLKVEFEVEVEGKMTEQEVASAVSTLRGITYEE